MPVTPKTILYRVGKICGRSVLQVYEMFPVDGKEFRNEIMTPSILFLHNVLLGAAM